jgi:hypothetical protein
MEEAMTPAGAEIDPLLTIYPEYESEAMNTARRGRQAYRRSENVNEKAKARTRSPAEAG